jgi:hypothetical protein
VGVELCQRVWDLECSDKILAADVPCERERGMHRKIPDIHLNRMGEHAVTGCVMLRLGFGAKFTEFNT